MPGIYVASLSDYNAGHFHGEWIELDAVTHAEDVHDGIADMLKRSPIPGAEEFAIHDYDGFGSIHLGEWEPIERLVLLAQLIKEHGEHVVSAFVSDVVGDDTPITDEELRESYRGEYDSEEAFAQSFLIDEGIGYRGATPEQLTQLADLIDWDAVAADLSDAFQYVRSGARVLVFERNVGG